MTAMPLNQSISARRQIIFQAQKKPQPVAPVAFVATFMCCYLRQTFSVYSSNTGIR